MQEDLSLTPDGNNVDPISILVSTAANPVPNKAETAVKKEKYVDSAKRKLTSLTQHTNTENLDSDQSSPQPLSSTSLSNINDSKDPKKSHHSAFMNLFSGKSKQQPPNSLENLSVKVAPKSQKDANPATTPGCSSTSSSSMGFLQKLPFHYLHSNPRHEKQVVNADQGTVGSPILSQHQEMMSNPSQVHALFPVKELESPVSARYILEGGSPIIGAEETWYPASEQAANRQELLNLETKAVTLERDVIQKALDELLTEFRSGQMKALLDKELEEMRAMHYQQLQLSALHMDVYKQEMDLYDPTTRKSNVKGDDLDEKYADISRQLDHLHEMMGSFHS